MSRKTLLTETEVRQFLKLANLKSVGDARIQEMGGYSMPGQRDAEDREDEDPAGESLEEQEDELDMGAEEGGEEDMEMDVELGGEEDMEMGAEDDMDLGAEGGAGTVDVQDFMDALETALEDVLGEPVTVDDEEDEEDLEMDAAPEDEEGLDMEMGDEEEEEPMMEDDLINEVARRVAARLQAQQNKAKTVDDLAERIFKRLTQ